MSVTLRRATMAALVAVPLVALAGGGLSGPAAGESARTGRYWIVLGSDRDGQSRPYSVRSDGSRLTPLLGRGQGIEAVALSRDGSTIAYRAHRGGSTQIYVSRADGTGFRSLVRVDEYYAHPALSSNGSTLAFANHGQISIIGTDGQGNRRLTAGSDPDWSPDGRNLVFEGPRGVVVQPLSGARREVVRSGMGSRPVWSPDGRWIAYLRYRASRQPHVSLNVVRPDGRNAHRVAPGASTFAWSPDGRRLAFGDADISENPRFGIVGVHGRRLRWLRLGVSPAPAEGFPGIAWSPDGRRLIVAAHAGKDANQIWTVRVNGRGLRHVTSSGTNTLIGWAALAPVRAPARPVPPTERVSGARTVVSRTAITDLSADGRRAAFVTASTATDCDHIDVWTPGKKAIRRASPTVPAPCLENAGAMYGLTLAGSRLAWAEIIGCGNYCDVELESATLGARRAQDVSVLYGSFSAGEGDPWDFHAHGEGSLLVFNDGPRLVRIGAGRENCEGDPSERGICTTIRRGSHVESVDSVSAGLIAVREPDQVAVVDGQGTVVRTIPFTTDDVSVARLDAGHLVVARLAFLEQYDVATGVREVSRPLPARYVLTDFDASTGIAVLRRPKTIMLLRLADGATRILRPTQGPVLADLDARGLYYSYSVGRHGRLVFVPRSKLLQGLH